MMKENLLLVVHHSLRRSTHKKMDIRMFVRLVCAMGVKVEFEGVQLEDAHWDAQATANTVSVPWSTLRERGTAKFFVAASGSEQAM